MTGIGVLLFYLHVYSCLALALVERDRQALAHDRAIYPIDTAHRWEGSEAQRLLLHDMDRLKHMMMKPKKLYMSRSECHENWSLTEFRGHIDQESELRKLHCQFNMRK